MSDPDHRLMTPPSLRVSKRVHGDKGSVVSVWDLRISQPNVAHVATDAMHSLEHFMGSLLPERCAQVVNVAPLGCQTGFYIVSIDLDDFDTLAGHLEAALQAVLKATEVPLANVVQCGWARNHSLDGAKNIADWLLRRRAHWVSALYE